MYLKLKEACQYLSISAPLMRRLVLNGQIPFYRIADLKRYKTEDLEEFMKERKANGVHEKE